MQDTLTATVEMAKVETPINCGIAYSAERKLSAEEQIELVKVLTTPRPLTDTMKRALKKELECEFIRKNTRT
jgi:hypothetical protein